MAKLIVYIRTTGIFDDSRATKEIKALLESGYKVVVLAWDRDGNSIEQCKNVFNKYDNLRFIFYENKIDNGVSLKKTVALLKWYRWLRGQLGKIHGISIIHACNLDAGFVARKYCKKYNCQLVYDIYDYYIDSHTIPTMISSFVEREEIRVINSADLTIICTEERKEQIIKAHPKDLLVIHNSPEIENVTSNSNSVDYVYCGTMNGGRLIAEILENYHENSNYSMIFAGNGRLSSIARKLSETWPNFSYRGAIPYSEVLNIESQATVISAIYSPDVRNHKLCAPNKFYEALALGKPIIVCRGTGIDRIVEDEQIGMVINYDAKQFYEVLKYLTENADICTRMSKKARMLYEKRYSWSIMKKRLIEKYQQLSVE